MKTSLQERFETFHGKNPKIYESLVRFAIEVHDRGVKRYGMKALFERLRWHMDFEVKSEEHVRKPFKLSNDFTACYARLIMFRNPAFNEFFALKAQRCVFDPARVSFNG